MVKHKDSEEPVELAERKSNIIVEDHVNELSDTTHNTINTGPNKENLLLNSSKGPKMRRKWKKQKKRRKLQTKSSKSNNSKKTATVTEIDASDLNDLNTVYTKCKKIMKKIVSKYVLNIDGKVGFSRCVMNDSVYSESNEDECHSKSKKKIVFDDEGETLIIPSDRHNFNQTATEINDSDLHELKTVYAKCEDVMKKIDFKYGHVWNVDSEEGSSRCEMKETVNSESLKNELHCKSKKIIVFDDEGKVTTSSKNNNFNQTSTEFIARDVSELKTVYMNCEKVMKKIDSKYGKVLNIDGEEGSSRYLIKENVIPKSNDDECFCKSNKKIVLDDVGEIAFNQTTIEIEARDLNEVRKEYTKYEEIMKEIEYKYKHNLSIADSEEGSCGYIMKETVYSDSYEHECRSKYKNKIVFDGEQRQSEYMNGVPSTSSKHSNNVVEYENSKLQLPLTLSELRELLKMPDIEDTFRIKIFDKIKSRKLHYKYEMKSERRNLIKQLKTNPDDVLNFKGTNLSSISGYSIY